MTLLGLTIVLLLTFYLLAKICDDYFVDSLDRIAHKFKLSQDVAGATLMAIGSSAPELFIAIIALIKPGGHAEIGMGTIVGSALFNILVIVGITAVVKKAILTWQPVVRDTIFYAISILVLLLVFKDGQIEIDEAAIFVALYIGYLIAVVNWKKLLPHRSPKNKTPDLIEKVEEKISLNNKPIDKILRTIYPTKEKFYLVFSLSIFLIAILSWVLVESAVKISTILNIPEAIIALTVLAIGTSIPDMISSIIVAKEGRSDMAISNAIGSNIFDILFGLGVPWLVLLTFSSGPIPVSTENLLTSVFLLFATVVVIITLLIIRKWKISRFAGFSLISIYLAYLVWAIYSL